MSRIVREHYPVAELPEFSKEGFEPDDYVRVTLETKSRPGEDSIAVQQDRLEELFAQAEPGFESLEQIAGHIDALRKEWD